MTSVASQRVVASAEFFDSMLNLIPVAYYYPPEQEEMDSKFEHNKKVSAGQLSQGKKKRKGAPSVTESASEHKQELAAKKARIEHRQDLFDPANYRTVVDLQRVAERVPPPSHPAQPKTPNPFTAAPAQEVKAVPKKKTPAAAPAEHRAGSMDELRARLHQKLDQLSSKRKHDPTTQEKIRLAKFEKSKQKLAEAKKKPKRTVAHEDEDMEMEAQPSGSKHAVHDSEPSNADEELNFTFGAVKKEEKQQLGKKKRESDSVALRKAEARREHLAKLAAKDPEAAKEAKRQDAIKSSLLRMQGVTVKDDIKLLKKKLKQSDKGRQKSQKEWKARGTAIAEATKQKQMKRNENLKNRALNTKKAVKKRSRPGFESGATKFLNWAALELAQSNLTQCNQYF